MKIILNESTLLRVLENQGTELLDWQTDRKTYLLEVIVGKLFPDDYMKIILNESTLLRS